MITAIPMNQQQIAPHFTKAISVAFFDQQGNEIHRVANPALGEGCAGKAAMLQLLQQYKADRILVRRIGQKMLSRLLSANFKILQINREHACEQNLATIADNELTHLTDANQGTPSINFDKKHSEGKKCCQSSGHAHHQAAGGCCKNKGSRQHGQQARCCH